MNLKDPTLLRHDAYIDGEWQQADNRATFEVHDPSNGASLGTVPLMGETETRRAIDAANAAWPAWRKKTAKERAGVPNGVLSILTGDPKAIGAEMTRNPIVRKLSFTGSTAVGRLLMAQSAPTVKKVTLELGGNAPFIVFDDADLDAAVQGAVASKYRNSGQTCICTNRFYVHERVYDAFAQKLADAVGKLKIGRGTDEGVALGPLINEAAVQKVESHIADALAKGAAVTSGGKRHALGHGFFEATVLTGVTQDMNVAREETFGPLAPLFKFSSDDEVVRMANDTEFGLAAYFYSRDIGCVWRVARGGSARIRHGGHQHRADLERSRAVRRREAIGPWPRRFALRHRRLRGDQVSLHGRFMRRASAYPRVEAR